MGRLTDRSDISIAVYHGSKAKKKKKKKPGITENNVLISFNPVSFGVYLAKKDAISNNYLTSEKTRIFFTLLMVGTWIYCLEPSRYLFY